MNNNLLNADVLSYELIKTTDTHVYNFSDGTVLKYQKKSVFKSISEMPSDFGLFIKKSFSKDNIPNIGYMTASTIVLIKYDREIYEETKRFGKKINISTEDKTKTYLRFKGVSLFRGPSDLGSSMYFIGDGWVSIGLFSYFKTYGILKKDLRASSTANQLFKGLLMTGLTTQFLKWSFGREMPKMTRDNSSGKWRSFSKDYIKNRKRYDAFPSGHIATGAMCLSIISTNYPEKTYIKPLGYSLLSLLAFQMINNGVHWAGDYPLGFALGWGIGKSISSKYLNDEKKPQKSFEIYPYISYDSRGFMGIFRF